MATMLTLTYLNDALVIAGSDQLLVDARHTVDRSAVAVSLGEERLAPNQSYSLMSRVVLPKNGSLLGVHLAGRDVSNRSNDTVHRYTVPSDDHTTSKVTATRFPPRQEPKLTPWHLPPPLPLPLSHLLPASLLTKQHRSSRPSTAPHHQPQPQARARSS
jgi:hypothetical protein